MRDCIFKLIDDLLAKVWRWDGKTVIVQRLGLAADLAKLRADFDSSGLGVLEVDSMSARGVIQ
jgi:hypothetical protein